MVGKELKLTEEYYVLGYSLICKYLHMTAAIDLVAVTSSMCVKYHTSDNSDVRLLLLFQYCTTSFDNMVFVCLCYVFHLMM